MIQNEGNYEQLLTVKEVAKILKVNETTVRRWIKEGALPAILLPKSRGRKNFRIRKSVLDTILNPGKEQDSQ
jgi:excisionase family DNA binding protein